MFYIFFLSSFLSAFWMCKTSLIQHSTFCYSKSSDRFLVYFPEPLTHQGRQKADKLVFWVPFLIDLYEHLHAFFINKLLNGECTFLFFCILFVTGGKSRSMHRLSVEYSSCPLLLQRQCPEKYRIAITNVKREKKEAWELWGRKIMDLMIGYYLLASYMLCAAVKEVQRIKKTEPATFSSWTPRTVSALSRVYTEDFMVKWLILIQDNLNPGHCNLNIGQSNCPVSFIGFLTQHWYGCAALILLCTTMAHVQNNKALITQRANTYLEEYLKKKVQMGNLCTSLVSTIL